MVKLTILVVTLFVSSLIYFNTGERHDDESM
jgi:hypothetical protein